jgi:hypothetical protein
MPLPLFIAQVQFNSTPNHSCQRGLVVQVPLLVEICWRNNLADDELQPLPYSRNTLSLFNAALHAGKAKECLE